MINQCYPAIFYSEFPIKTLTQINLNYKQLFDRPQKQKLQKVGYKHYKTCQFTYLLYLPMQQICLAEPLVSRACISGTSPVSLSNIGSLIIFLSFLGSCNFLVLESILKNVVSVYLLGFHSEFFINWYMDRQVVSHVVSSG